MIDGRRPRGMARELTQLPLVAVGLDWTQRRGSFGRRKLRFFSPIYSEPGPLCSKFFLFLVFCGIFVPLADPSSNSFLLSQNLLSHSAPNALSLLLPGTISLFLSLNFTIFFISIYFSLFCPLQF